MKTARNEPRPTLHEFLGCCRTEFAFLVGYGFQEAPATTAGHPDPFRFCMAGAFLELYARGIHYGLDTYVSLRDHSGREYNLGQLTSASRAAMRLRRRRHPDGQRAAIAAAARALRDFPAILSAHDLATVPCPISDGRNA